MQALWLLILLVVLLTISALISGSETAFFSLTPGNINDLKNENSSGSKAILNLLEKPDLLLSTILIGNNLVNIGAIITANSLLGSIMTINSPVLEFIIKVVLVTFLLLLFGEIIPKIFAAYNSMSLAHHMSVPIKVLRAIFKPFSVLLLKSGGMITRMLDRKKAVSIDDLQSAIEITDTDSAEDKKILSGILRFVSTEVVEIMKPRIDVVALDVEDNFAEVRKVIIESGFSRIPVYEESFDNIKGVLYIKDLFTHLDAADDFDWKKLLREPYYVPEHKKINDLLEDFQTKKIHLSVVVDEYGGTLGIVTLEDILEEIVGEISDESDRDESCYEKLDENNYIFDGGTSLGDFLRILSKPDAYLDNVKGEADTLAGVMLEIKGEFLNPGDSVVFEKITLRAQEVDHYRITKVKVTIEPEDAADTE